MCDCELNDLPELGGSLLILHCGVLVIGEVLSLSLALCVNCALILIAEAASLGVVEEC